MVIITNVPNHQPDNYVSESIMSFWEKLDGANFVHSTDHRSHIWPLINQREKDAQPKLKGDFEKIPCTNHQLLSGNTAMEHHHFQSEKKQTVKSLRTFSIAILD